MQYSLAVNVLPSAQRSYNWHGMDSTCLLTNFSKLSTRSFKSDFVLLLLQQIIESTFLLAPFQIDLENAQYELELLKVSLVHGGNQLVVYLVKTQFYE